MTTQFVQSRRNPPVLIPLRDLDSQPLATLRKRLQTMQMLIFPRRPYDPIEIEEMIRIKVLLGLLPISPQKNRKAAVPVLTEAQIGTLTSELLA